MILCNALSISIPIPRLIINLLHQDLAESRLVEGTFTCDEVREMLSGLSGAVRADVESELITTAHTNALLLRELFADAEKWHLKLQADINKLETRYVGR